MRLLAALLIVCALGGCSKTLIDKDQARLMARDACLARAEWAWITDMDPRGQVAREVCQRIENGKFTEKSRPRLP